MRKRSPAAVLYTWMRQPVGCVVPECCYSVVFFFLDWLMNPGVRHIPAVNGTQSTRVRQAAVYTLTLFGNLPRKSTMAYGSLPFNMLHHVVRPLV